MLIINAVIMNIDTFVDSVVLDCIAEKDSVMVISDDVGSDSWPPAVFTNMTSADKLKLKPITTSLNETMSRNRGNYGYSYEADHRRARRLREEQDIYRPNFEDFSKPPWFYREHYSRFPNQYNAGPYHPHQQFNAGPSYPHHFNTRGYERARPRWLPPPANKTSAIKPPVVAAAACTEAITKEVKKEILDLNESEQAASTNAGNETLKPISDGSNAISERIDTSNLLNLPIFAPNRVKLNDNVKCPVPSTNYRPVVTRKASSSQTPILDADQFILSGDINGSSTREECILGDILSHFGDSTVEANQSNVQTLKKKPSRITQRRKSTFVRKDDEFKAGDINDCSGSEVVSSQQSVDDLQACNEPIFTDISVRDSELNVLVTSNDIQTIVVDSADMNPNECSKDYSETGSESLIANIDMHASYLNYKPTKDNINIDTIKQIEASTSQLGKNKKITKSKVTTNKSATKSVSPKLADNKKSTKSISNSLERGTSIKKDSNLTKPVLKLNKPNQLRATSNDPRSRKLSIDSSLSPSTSVQLFNDDYNSAESVLPESREDPRLMPQATKSKLFLQRGFKLRTDDCPSSEIKMIKLSDYVLKVNKLSENNEPQMIVCETINKHTERLNDSNLIKPTPKIVGENVSKVHNNKSDTMLVDKKIVKQARIQPQFKIETIGNVTQIIKICNNGASANIIHEALPSEIANKRRIAETPSADIIHKQTPSANIIHKQTSPSANIIHKQTPPSANIIQKQTPPSENIIHKQTPSANIIHKQTPPSENIIHKQTPSANIRKQTPPSANIIQKQTPPSANIIHKQTSSANITHKATSPSSNIIHKQTTSANITHKATPPSELARRQRIANPTSAPIIYKEARPSEIVKKPRIHKNIKVMISNEDKEICELHKREMLEKPKKSFNRIINVPDLVDDDVNRNKERNAEKMKKLETPVGCTSEDQLKGAINMKSYKIPKLSHKQSPANASLDANNKLKKHIESKLKEVSLKAKGINTSVESAPNNNIQTNICDRGQSTTSPNHDKKPNAIEVITNKTKSASHESTKLDLKTAVINNIYKRSASLASVRGDSVLVDVQNMCGIVEQSKKPRTESIDQLQSTKKNNNCITTESTEHPSKVTISKRHKLDKSVDVKRKLVSGDNKTIISDTNICNSLSELNITNNSRTTNNYKSPLVKDVTNKKMHSKSNAIVQRKSSLMKHSDKLVENCYSNKETEFVPIRRNKLDVNKEAKPNSITKRRESAKVYNATVQNEPLKAHKTPSQNEIKHKSPKAIPQFASKRERSKSCDVQASLKKQKSDEETDSQINIQSQESIKYTGSNNNSIEKTIKLPAKFRDRQKFKNNDFATHQTIVANGTTIAVSTQLTNDETRPLATINNSEIVLNKPSSNEVSSSSNVSVIKNSNSSGTNKSAIKVQPNYDISDSCYKPSNCIEASPSNNDSDTNKVNTNTCAIKVHPNYDITTANTHKPLNCIEASSSNNVSAIKNVNTNKSAIEATQNNISTAYSYKPNYKEASSSSNVSVIKNSISQVTQANKCAIETHRNNFLSNCKEINSTNSNKNNNATTADNSKVSIKPNNKKDLSMKYGKIAVTTTKESSNEVQPWDANIRKTGNFKNMPDLFDSAESVISDPTNTELIRILSDDSLFPSSNKNIVSLEVTNELNETAKMILLDFDEDMRSPLSNLESEVYTDIKDEVVSKCVPDGTNVMLASSDTNVLASSDTNVLASSDTNVLASSSTNVMLCSRGTNAMLASNETIKTNCKSTAVERILANAENSTASLELRTNSPIHTCANNSVTKNAPTTNDTSAGTSGNSLKSSKKRRKAKKKHSVPTLLSDEIITIEDDVIKEEVVDDSYEDESESEEQGSIFDKTTACSESTTHSQSSVDSQILDAVQYLATSSSHIQNSMTIDYQSNFETFIRTTKTVPNNLDAINQAIPNNLQLAPVENTPAITQASQNNLQIVPDQTLVVTQAPQNNLEPIDNAPLNQPQIVLNNFVNILVPPFVTVLVAILNDIQNSDRIETMQQNNEDATLLQTVQVASQKKLFNYKYKIMSIIDNVDVVAFEFQALLDAVAAKYPEDLDALMLAFVAMFPPQILLKSVFANNFQRVVLLYCLPHLRARNERFFTYLQRNGYAMTLSGEQTQQLVTQVMAYNRLINQVRATPENTARPLPTNASRQQSVANARKRQTVKILPRMQDNTPMLPPVNNNTSTLQLANVSLLHPANNTSTLQPANVSLLHPANNTSTLQLANVSLLHPANNTSTLQPANVSLLHPANNTSTLQLANVSLLHLANNTSTLQLANVSMQPGANVSRQSKANVSMLQPANVTTQPSANVSRQSQANLSTLPLANTFRMQLPTNLTERLNAIACMRPPSNAPPSNAFKRPHRTAFMQPPANNSNHSHQFENNQQYNGSATPIQTNSMPIQSQQFRPPPPPYFNAPTTNKRSNNKGASKSKKKTLQDTPRPPTNAPSSSQNLPNTNVYTPQYALPPTQGPHNVFNMPAQFVGNTRNDLFNEPPRPNNVNNDISYQADTQYFRSLPLIVQAPLYVPPNAPNRPNTSYKMSEQDLRRKQMYEMEKYAQDCINRAQMNQPPLNNQIGTQSLLAARLTNNQVLGSHTEHIQRVAQNVQMQQMNQNLQQPQIAQKQTTNNVPYQSGNEFRIRLTQEHVQYYQANSGESNESEGEIVDRVVGGVSVADQDLNQIEPTVAPQPAKEPTAEEDNVKQENNDNDVELVAVPDVFPMPWNWNLKDEEANDVVEYDYLPEPVNDFVRRDDPPPDRMPSIDSGIESPPLSENSIIQYNALDDHICICGRPADLVCECGGAIYCSEDCQMRDWIDRHKYVCTFIEEV